MRQKHASLPLLLLPLALMGGCRRAPTPSPAIASVTAVTVQAMNADDAPPLRYFGTVRPHRQVELAFRVSGYVQALLRVRDATGKTRPVQAGDRVTAGAILARIGSADYRAQSEAARAAVKAAHAKAAQAGGQLTQARAVQRQSADAVQEAQAALQAAQAQRVQAVSGVGQAEAALNDAQAGVTLAQSNWERTDDLYRSRSATGPQRDATQAALASATAKLNAARQARDAAQGRIAEADAQISICKARIRQAQSGAAAGLAAISEASAAVQATQAQVSQADAAQAAQRVPVAETVLRAPLTGVVLARKIEIGSLVAPGIPAFSIADTSRLTVAFGLPEQEVKRLHPGRRVTLTVGSDKTQTGLVTNVAPMADEKTRVFEVQVTVPNVQGVMKIGMTAVLAIGADEVQNTTLVVPLSAITQSPDQPSGAAVMVILSEGGRLTARRRDVEVGATFGDKVAVRGVSRGARIVADASALLYDGEPVIIAAPDAGGGG